jgi:hypothetical protein
MNTHRLFLVATAIAATSLIAGCGGSGDSGTPASAPANSTDGVAQSASAPAVAAAGVDACTLLTTDEVAQLFPQPTSKAVDASQPGESTCRWEGGADPSNVPPDLVLDVRAMPKDFPLDQAKGSLAAEGKQDGNQVISDLGDIGIVKSAIDGVATVTWIQSPYLVSIDLSATGAEKQHDAVVTTARAASARIG